MRLDPRHLRHALGGRAPRWPFGFDGASRQADGLVCWVPFPGFGAVRDHGPLRQGNFLQTGTSQVIAPSAFDGHELDFVAAPDDDRFALTGQALPTATAADFAISCWCRFRSFVSLSNVWGFGASLPSSTGGVQRYFIQFNGNYYFWGGGADFDTGVALDTDNAYRHIVFSVSGGNPVTFYRDGVQAASGNHGGAYATAGSTITIGSGHSGATAAFDGAVFDCRIYNRAIGAAEAWAMYDPATRWDLYRERPLRRAWPAAAGGVTGTLTGSLDAAARKQIAAAAAADAALGAVRDAQAALDSALERAIGAQAGADGAVRALRTLSTTAEAATVRALGLAAALDASVTGAGIGLRGAALDAAVERLLALVTALTAALSRLRALQAGLDAGLAVPGVRPAPLDSVIARLDILAGLALEAAVRHSADLTAVLDAVIGNVVATGADRTFQVPARGGHAVAGDLRTLAIPGGNRRH